MSFGYRIFVVEDEAVTRISQKAFNNFYFRESGRLNQYRARTILVVVAMFALVNRKAVNIVRTDTQRIRVDADGLMDKDHLNEGLFLAANRMSASRKSGESTAKESSSVVDAKELFDERRWKQRHPELHGPALKNILTAIFGVSE